MTKTTTRQQYCLLQETAAPTGSQEEASLPDLPSRVPTSLISRMNNIFTEYLDIVAPRGCVEAFGQRLPLVPSLPPSRCGWWSCIHEYPKPENIQPNIQPQRISNPKEYSTQEKTQPNIVSESWFLPSSPSLPGFASGGFLCIFEYFTTEIIFLQNQYKTQNWISLPS